MLVSGLLIALALAQEPSIDPPDAAEEAFRRGSALYAEGKYPEAAAAFEQAYAANRDPAVLYAWAQSERLQEHWSEASRLYREYIDTGAARGLTTPFQFELFTSAMAAREAEDCGRTLGLVERYRLVFPPVEGETAELSETYEAADRAQAWCEQKLAPKDRPAEERRTPRRWYRSLEGGLLSAAGLVGLAAGSAVLATGSRMQDVAASEPTHDEARGRFIAGRRRVIGGAITVAASGALAITAIVFYAMAARTEREGRAERLTWSTEGIGVRF